MRTAGSGQQALGGALLIAAVAIAYAPALAAGFVFDDHPLLLGGQVLANGPLSRIWFSADAPDYLPLTWTSFWVEWRLWGDRAVGYHVVNVVLHAGAAVLLWRVLRALRVPGAYVGALLFALHPAAVESVAWISERKNTLSLVFFLATALAWIAARKAERDGGASPGRGRALHVLAIALFGLALLSKSSVVMLPVALLGVAAAEGGFSRRDVVNALPLFALALAAGIATIWFQAHNALAGETLPPRGLGERLAGAAWSLAAYLRAAFVPVHLPFVHAPSPAIGTAAFVAPILLLLAVAAAAVWGLRSGRARPVSLALGYHAAMVLPVLGFIDMAYFRIAPIANHLQYLALIGPAALGGYSSAWLAERFPRAMPIGAAAVALLLGSLTHGRARAFESELTLWEEAVRVEPSSAFAHKQLALTLLELGRTADAIREVEATADATPDPAERDRARAMAAFIAGRFDEAVAHAQRAERIRPDPGFQRDLATELARAGRTAEAIAVAAPLVADDPRDGEARYWLADALTRAGRLAEAEDLLSEGLRLAPADRRLREAVESVRTARARARSEAGSASSP
jgi:tetratricopeptide (TPR) repeat protein